MSTQKWSDDDLDDLFRQSAEESDPAYDPAAWQDLKARLNERDRTLLQNKLLRWTVPILLFLLSTTGLFWYTGRGNITESTVTTRQSKTGDATQTGRLPVVKPATRKAPILPVLNSPTTTKSPGSTNFQPENTTRSVPQNDPKAGSATVVRTEKDTAGSRIVGQQIQPAAGNRIVDPSLTGQAGNRPVTSDKPTRFGPSGNFVLTAGQPQRTSRITGTRLQMQPDDNLARKAEEETTRRSQSEFGKMPVTGPPADHLNDTARQDAKPGGLGRHRSGVSGLVTNPDVAKNTIPNKLTSVETSLTASERVGSDDEPVTPAAWLNWPGLLSAKGTKWPALPTSITEPVAPEPAALLPRSARARLTGLSIQLVAAPDLTTVGLRNFDQPGTNVGLMAQYQLSARFSAQAGALWSTKRYTTSPSEYVWPFPGYTHVYPESVTGKCTMFDIPVNLRYDVLLRPGRMMGSPSRWFVSGGVTSYFIDREVYDYTYANPNNPAITRRRWDNKVAGRKGGKFGLSHLNVSLGYEQSISRRLSWQAEPFLKVPVQQIGFFRVRLISTGAFVSLRYRL